MARAVSMITFKDREDNKVYNIRVIVNDNFSIEHEYVGEVLPEVYSEPKEEAPKTIGDKVEGFIDRVTGGQLKKCGGCARRKQMLDKLQGAKDEQQTSTTSGDAV